MTCQARGNAVPILGIEIVGNPGLDQRLADTALT